MDTANSGTSQLSTALIIGIVIDVVLAIVAGVLVYWWRKRSNERNERKLLARYVSSQRLDSSRDGESVDTGPAGSEDQRHVNPVGPAHRDSEELKQSDQNERSDSDAERVEGNFAFLDSQSNHISEPERQEVPEVKEHRASRVTFSELDQVVGEEKAHYPANSEERVIHNPLIASTSSQGRSALLDSEQSGDIAVTTYYTYRPPANQLDGEASETMSEGERSPTVTSNPPASNFHPGRTISNPMYETIGDFAHETDKNDTMTMWKTVNFGEEDVSKLYNVEMELSTDIM